MRGDADNQAVDNYEYSPMELDEDDDIVLLKCPC